MTRGHRRSTTDSGNFISEWFGYRVYPTVAENRQGLKTQKEGRCPFLTEVTYESRECVKKLESKGVCTISSKSNGTRQDWLVCPFRTLTPSFITAQTKALFGISTTNLPLVVPGPALAKIQIREAIETNVRNGNPVVVYLQAKLGGEVSIPSTPASPELAFDFALVELIKSTAGIALGRYGLMEIQTMDFHGTYKHAVKNLTDALRLHPKDFFSKVSENSRWMAEKIEGPNTANVFKRTLYQTILKFQISRDESCAGCMLTIPESVWDSWQKHIGAPELSVDDSGVYCLAAPGLQIDTQGTSSWICVFDIDASSAESPNPIVIKKLIRTDAKALATYAFEVVPGQMIAARTTTSKVYSIIRDRLTSMWPELLFDGPEH